MTDTAAAKMQLAATLAQVVPVLFLAIALEQRSLPRTSRVQGRWASSLIMLTAAAGEIFSLGYLSTAAFPDEKTSSAQVDLMLWISAAGTMLLLVFVLFWGFFLILSGSARSGADGS